MNLKTFNKLELCLNSADEAGDNFIFASDYWNPNYQTAYSVYSHLPTPCHFWQFSKDISPENKAYYEIIRGDRPHKIYADLEWEDINWKSVYDVKKWFLDLMSAEGLNSKKFYFLNASKGNKGSLHVIGDYNFKTITSQKTFWSKIKEKIFTDERHGDFIYTKETDSNFIQTCPIDFCVYNKNRQFRLPYSSKMDKKTGELKRPLLPNVDLNEDTFDNFVISLFDEDFKMIETKPETKGEYTAGKRETMFSKNVVIELFKKHGCEFTGIKGNLILFKNANRNRKCLIGDEDNYSDNAFGVIKKDGIYYGCHDSGCQGKLKCIFNRYEHKASSPELSDNIPFNRWISCLSDDFSKIGEVVDDMNNYFIKITGDSKPYYLFREVSEDGIVSWKIRVKATLKECFENRFFIKGKTKKYMIDLWLNSENIRTYSTIDAMPVNICKKGVFNVFSGIKTDKEKAISKGNLEEGKIIGNFIRECWCDSDETIYDWVIKYLAHQVQKPFVKLRKSLVLKSIEGAGKGCIINKIGNIIGKEWYFQPTSSDEVFGEFNHKIRNRSFIFIDEMFYGGNKKEDGLLKKLITEENLTTNEKYMVQMTTTNRCNFIIASNIDWIIPVGPQARRYVILELKDGMTKMTEVEKKKIWGVSEESLAKFLWSIDLENWDSDKEISTNALLEQKTRNLNDPISWLYQGIKDEIEFPFEKEIEKTDFYIMFKAYFPSTRSSNVAFWRDINKIFDPIASQKTINGKRVRMITLPNKEDVKGLLESFLKQKI